MRAAWVIALLSLGCSSSSTNDGQNPNGGTGGIDGGSGGTSAGGSSASGGTSNGGSAGQSNGGSAGQSNGGSAGQSNGGSAGQSNGGTGGAAGMGGASGAGGTGGCTGTGIRINEVKTRGATASDEFVELYNSGQNQIALTGFEMKVADAAGGVETIIWNGTPTDLIPPQGFFLIVGTGYSGAFGAKFATANVLPNDGGIRIATAPVLDAVAWGALNPPNHPFLEGQPATNGVSGTSMVRTPNGHDCNDNKTDFSVAATPTPGASNNP